MKRYSKKLFIEVIVLLLLTNLLIVFLGNEQQEDNAWVKYTVEADKTLNLEIFYSKEQVIAPENVSTWNMSNNSESVNFSIIPETNYLRMDFGDKESDIQLKNVVLGVGKNEIPVSNQQLEDFLIDQNDIGQIDFNEDAINIKTTGSDPYIIFHIESLNIKETADTLNTQKLQKEKIIFCAILDILVLLIFFLFPGTFTTPFEILVNRTLLCRLAVNDFSTRYAGSYFGIFWAFVQPGVTIVLYWFVFQVGLGAGPVNGHPFVIWLIAGLIPWMFFQDAVLYGTNALFEYSYLVKKVVFEVDILPMVKIISAFFVHVFFLAISTVLFTAMGYFPGIFCLQLLYYSACTAIFAIAVAYCTSAIVLFFRDLGQIINIALQIGTWMTPIMWQITIMPENLRWIFKLNPMFYVVQGYRDSVMDKVWFWNRLGDTMYFWIFVVILFALANGIFQRLKPHFADVL